MLEACGELLADAFHVSVTAQQEVLQIAQKTSVEMELKALTTV